MYEPETVPILRRHRASARINPCIYLPPANPPSLGFMLNRTFGSAAAAPPCRRAQKGPELPRGLNAEWSGCAVAAHFPQAAPSVQSPVNCDGWRMARRLASDAT